MNPTLRALIRTDLGRYLLIPYRARQALMGTTRRSGQLWRWLLESREFTNYTYDYSPLGEASAVELVSLLCGARREQVQRFREELRDDLQLRAHYTRIARDPRYRNVVDAQMRLSRQSIYYLLVRVMKPRVVVEAGCDRGLGSLLIASALARNESEQGDAGHLHTIDLNPEAGFLFSGPYARYGTLHTLSSVEFLRAFSQGVDLFIHDTANDDAHVREQLSSLGHTLKSSSIVMTTWFSQGFADFCTNQGFHFLSFMEDPAHPWYRGCRLGFAFREIVTAPNA